MILMEDDCEPFEVIFDDLHEDFELWVLLILEVLVLTVVLRTLNITLDVLHQVLGHEDLLVIGLLADDRTRIEVEFESFPNDAETYSLHGFGNGA